MSANAPHVVSTRTYFAVFGALLALTGLTVLAASHHFGHFNDVIALAIAGTKAMLVVLYFMHLRHATGLTRVFVIAGVFWLGLLFVFIFSDLLTRQLSPPTNPGAAPASPALQALGVPVERQTSIVVAPQRPRGTQET